MGGFVTDGTNEPTASSAINQRNWRVSLAFVGFVIAVAVIVSAVGLFSSYQRENREARERDTKNRAESARYQAEAECIGQPSGALSECLANAKYAEERASEPNHDLKAQQDMAEWGYAMWWTTLFGTLISTVGVLLVYLNLRAFQADVEAARRDAIVANERFQQQLIKMDAANQIAQDTGRKQVRAYLTVDNASAFFIGLPEGGVTVPHFRFNLTLKNTGLSPARKIRFNLQLTWRTKDGQNVEQKTIAIDPISAQSADPVTSFILCPKMNILTDAPHFDVVSVVLSVEILGIDVFNDPLDPITVEFWYNYNVYSKGKSVGDKVELMRRNVASVSSA